MFLRPLKDEQKKLFLTLAYKAAEANDIIEENEKQMLSAYADEMGIAVEVQSERPIKDVCQELKLISTPKELNQIAFEIVGLIVSDGTYDATEEMFVNELVSCFEIPIDRIKEMFHMVEEYTKLIRKINMLMSS